MGILRFLLAISVVIAHSAPLFGFTLVGGQIAVQCFYIISGFYMALILNEKYTGPNSYKIFITNRVLRLFPTYLLVLLLTLSLSVFFTNSTLKNYLSYSDRISITGLLYLAFSNILILGQELSLFTFLNNSGTLQLTANFQNAVSQFPKLHTFLFVPQAWTVSLELYFYLLAPFLVKKRPVLIIALVAGSVLLRLSLIAAGLYGDPWNYRFFPNELALFLSGVIAYKLYRYEPFQKTAQRPLFPLILVSIVFYQFLGFPSWLLYCALTLAIPSIFNITKGNRLDSFIGELSYPIYISHLFIIQLAKNTVSTLSLIICIILFSIAVLYLMKPVENLRARLAQKRFKRPYPFTE